MLDNMTRKRDHEDGFTLVELLVVILIIGILASIAVPVFLNQRDKGMEASQQSDLRQLESSISLAKTISGQPLYKMTGNSLTFGECNKELDPLDIPKDNVCWKSYLTSLKKISDISGIDIQNMLDPYGRPYLINPNELEINATDCRTDFIGYYGRDYAPMKPRYLKPLPMTMPVCVDKVTL